MIDINNLIITDIKNVQLWAEVPSYKKLDISYCIKMCLGCLIGSFESINGLKNYLRKRKEHNQKYQEFWSNTSNVKFDDDKSHYMVMHLDTIKDVSVK